MKPPRFKKESFADKLTPSKRIKRERFVILTTYSETSSTAKQHNKKIFNENDSIVHDEKIRIIRNESFANDF